MGTEEVTGPTQQRANLVELLLQYRLSHAVNANRRGRRTTIHQRFSAVGFRR
jgi:hypothetical protein